MRLSLPQVTLVAIDTRAPAIAAQSLQRSMAGIEFARAVLFTHGWPAAQVPDGIEMIGIMPIASGAVYSDFVLRQLPRHVRTSHVLVTQWDGFVVDPAQWRPEFLEHDYIGAVWPEQSAAQQVGNGGFSLRSQRFLQAGMDGRITGTHPEDELLCRNWRPWLEREHGIRFAPTRLARLFAFENEAPAGPTFGFHGPYNLPRFVDEPILAQWLAVLPDDFYRSRDARRVARALLRHGMPRTAAQVVERRLAVGRREPSTRLLGEAARLLSWWRP